MPAIQIRHVNPLIKNLNSRKAGNELLVRIEFERGIDLVVDAMIMKEVNQDVKAIGGVFLGDDLIAGCGIRNKDSQAEACGYHLSPYPLPQAERNLKNSSW